MNGGANLHSPGLSRMPQGDDNNNNKAMSTICLISWITAFTLSVLISVQITHTGDTTRDIFHIHYGTCILLYRYRTVLCSDGASTLKKCENQGRLTDCVGVL